MQAKNIILRSNNFCLVSQSAPLKGEVVLSGDKSITHRALIISALAVGRTTINNPAFNQDCLQTVAALKKLGARISLSQKSNCMEVFGKGLYGLSKAGGPVYAGESGTTIRLLAGVLAGQRFTSVLTCGKSLSARPMNRIIEPLRLMGCDIHGPPPLKIKGGGLKGIAYRLPVASAQVKSAILLAGLFAKGKTKVIEPVKTRDHTERMLKAFGADIKCSGNAVVIKGADKLVSPRNINIPCDVSSASFFITAAVLVPGSVLKIKRVNLNPTRAGFIKVLKRMGADIEVSPSTSLRADGERSRTIGSREAGVGDYEPVGDIVARSSKLKATVVREKEIPSLIDELPILMVAACFAKGKTEFRGVGELRVKETDRVNSLAVNLRLMGADVEIKVKTEKGKKIETVVIHGTKALKASKVKSFADHRTAMSLIIAALTAKGRTCIDDVSCIDKSFPGFLKTLESLKKKMGSELFL